jgi:AcrR family transcriptional regulator
MKTPPRAQGTRKRTRIQQINETKILDAGLQVFSVFGYHGSTIDQIAAEADMTKPNLLYYFRRKEDIYIAVLTRTLGFWLKPLAALDPDGDPETEIKGYIKSQDRYRSPGADNLSPFRNGGRSGRPVSGGRTVVRTIEDTVGRQSGGNRPMEFGRTTCSRRSIPPYFHDLGHNTLRNGNQQLPRWRQRRSTLREGTQNIGASLPQRD